MESNSLIYLIHFIQLGQGGDIFLSIGVCFASFQVLTILFDLFLSPLLQVFFGLPYFSVHVGSSLELA